MCVYLYCFREIAVDICQ